METQYAVKIPHFEGVSLGFHIRVAVSNASGVKTGPTLVKRTRGSGFHCFIPPHRHERA
jgi:hypothetical protein